VVPTVLPASLHQATLITEIKEKVMDPNGPLPKTKQEKERTEAALKSGKLV